MSQQMAQAMKPGQQPGQSPTMPNPPKSEKGATSAADMRGAPGTRSGDRTLERSDETSDFRPQLGDREMNAIMSTREDKLPANRRDADILKRYFKVFEPAHDEEGGGR